MEKGLLCPTAAVRNISEGKQTMIRLVIKKKYHNTNIEWFENKYGRRLVEMQNDALPRKLSAYRELNCPYELGDILWVRETWCKYDSEHVFNGKRYAYKANTSPESDRCRQDYIKSGFPYQWRSSSTMPRLAARLFLKVKSVRAERLRDITEEDVIAEGFKPTLCSCGGQEYACTDCMNTGVLEPAKLGFIQMWDNAWGSNPWVWVIEFELINS